MTIRRLPTAEQIREASSMEEFPSARQIAAWWPYLFVFFGLIWLLCEIFPLGFGAAAP